MISLTPRDDSVHVSPPKAVGPKVRVSPPTHVAVQAPPPAPSVGVVVPGGRGPIGEEGPSAYEVAVANGFVGTEVEWLESLSPLDMQDLTTLFENGLM